MNKYSTNQLRIMLAKVNEEINNIIKELDTAEHMKRLTVLRQTRVKLEQEIGMREFDEILQA